MRRYLTRRANHRHIFIVAVEGRRANHRRCCQQRFTTFAWDGEDAIDVDLEDYH
jgi:hypothetical protein